SARRQSRPNRAERNDPMTAAGASDWAADNQAYLAAMLDRVRHALEQHLQRGSVEPMPGTGLLEVPAMPQRPALAILVDRFGLSSFERDLLVLCAGVELDAGFAALCRDAGARPGPTFSLALAALPQSHWSAITPSGPLRYWKMIEVGPSDVLVTAPLRIDERILHFLAGVFHTDERLQFVTTSYPPPRAGLSPEHRAIAQGIAALWTAAATGGEPAPAIQLVGEDDAGLPEIAARAFRLRGLDMRIIHAHEIPHAAADRQL